LLLERFARRRAAPVLAMQTVTDTLARLFGATSPWIRDGTQFRHDRRRRAASRKAISRAFRATLTINTTGVPMSFLTTMSVPHAGVAIALAALLAVSARRRPRPARADR
jgi:hypothetical protein